MSDTRQFSSLSHQLVVSERLVACGPSLVSATSASDEDQLASWLDRVLERATETGKDQTIAFNADGLNSLLQSLSHYLQRSTDAVQYAPYLLEIVEAFTPPSNASLIFSQFKLQFSDRNGLESLQLIPALFQVDGDALLSAPVFQFLLASDDQELRQHLGLPPSISQQPTDLRKSLDRLGQVLMYSCGMKSHECLELFEQLSAVWHLAIKHQRPLECDNILSRLLPNDTTDLITYLMHCESTVESSISKGREEAASILYGCIVENVVERFNACLVAAVREQQQRALATINFIICPYSPKLHGADLSNDGRTGCGFDAFKRNLVAEVWQRLLRFGLFDSVCQQRINDGVPCNFDERHRCLTNDSTVDQMIGDGLIRMIDTYSVDATTIDTICNDIRLVNGGMLGLMRNIQDPLVLMEALRSSDNRISTRRFREASNNKIFALAGIQHSWNHVEYDLLSLNQDFSTEDELCALVKRLVDKENSCSSAVVCEPFHVKLGYFITTAFKLFQDSYVCTVQTLHSDDVLDKTTLEIIRDEAEFARRDPYQTILPFAPFLNQYGVIAELMGKYKSPAGIMNIRNKQHTFAPLRGKCVEFFEFVMQKFTHNPIVRQELNHPSYRIGLINIYLSKSILRLLTDLLWPIQNQMALRIQKQWFAFKQRKLAAHDEFVGDYEHQKSPGCLTEQMRNLMSVPPNESTLGLEYEKYASDIIQWIFIEILGMESESVPAKPYRDCLSSVHLMHVLMDGTYLYELSSVIFDNVPDSFTGSTQENNFALFSEVCRRILGPESTISSLDLIGNPRKVIKILRDFKSYVERQLQAQCGGPSSVDHLVESEQLYVSYLEKCVSYRKYLLGRQVVLSPKELDSVFGNISDISEFHRTIFLSYLNGAPQQLGEFFIQILSDSIIFDIYREYYRNLRESLSFLIAHRDRGVLKAYLEAFQTGSDLGNGKSLEWLLLRPYYRMSDYVDHLTAIMHEHQTSALLNEDETNSIKNALGYLNQTIVKLNDCLAGSGANSIQNLVTIIEDYQNLSDLDGVGSILSVNTAMTGGKGIESGSAFTVPACLVTTERKFICKGAVWEVINSNLVKERLLYLFNDCLIVAKEDEGQPGKQQIRTIVDLSKMQLNESRFQDPQERKISNRTFAKAIRLFNNNARVAITYLIDKGLVSSTPQSVAEFLFGTDGLNPRQIGLFFGVPDNREILVAYLKVFDFTDLPLDIALRLFLSSFRLPGETKAIDSILDVFSLTYLNANPKFAPRHDVVLRMVFALLMLNAELNGAEGRQAKTGDRMSVSEFCSSFLENCSPEGEFEIYSNAVLTRLYNSIAKEKLSVAMSSHEEEDKMSIQISQMPYRLSINQPSRKIIVRIPRPDPGLMIRICPHQGLESSHKYLKFKDSHEARFTITGTSLGRKSLMFLKFGPSASNYTSSSLPHGKSIVVEPPFMQHVFQLKTIDRDPVTKKKVSLMFSVSNADQKENWLMQLRTIWNVLSGDSAIDYGISLDSVQALELLQGFTVNKEDVRLLPANNSLKFRKFN